MSPDPKLLEEYTESTRALRGVLDELFTETLSLARLLPQWVAQVVRYGNALGDEPDEGR